MLIITHLITNLFKKIEILKKPGRFGICQVNSWNMGDETSTKFFKLTFSYETFGDIEFTKKYF